MVISTLVSLGLFGLSFSARALEKPVVSVMTIEAKEDSKKLLYPARVEAQSSSMMTADFDGHVRKVMKPLGSKVRAGEAVLRLENIDPAFTYASVPIVSPINGVVSQIYLPLMAKVSKGDRLFSVIGNDAVKIFIEIPGYEIQKLALGQVGEFKSSFNAIETRPVRLRGLSPVIDPQTGTATGELEFQTDKSKKEQLIPPVGSVGQVSFKVESAKSIIIPESAIRFLKGKPFLRLIDNKLKVFRKDVELGEQRDDFYVVKSGLKEGDRIIVRENMRIKPGDTVEIETEVSKAK